MDMEQFTYNINVITEFFKLHTQLTSSKLNLDVQIDNYLKSQLETTGFSNLSVLKLILHLKYNLIKEGHSSKINIKYENLFKNINFQENDNILQELGDVIKILISVMTEPVEFCKLIINKARDDYVDEKYVNLLVEAIKSFQKNGIEWRQLKPLLSELIIAGIPRKYSISIFICYSLLPVYLKLSNDYGILIRIYRMILLRYPFGQELSGELQNKILLCSLSDILFMDFGKEYLYYILHETELWCAIYLGLKLSDCTRLNKVSLFLLKYCINTVFSKFEEFSLPRWITFNKTNKSLCFTSWQNYIILYETLLDETQTHIIMPVLSLLDSLKYLNPDWESFIYRQLLVRKSNIVHLYGIDRIFDSKFLRRENNCLDYIYSELFASLNDICLYQSDSSNHIRINGQLQAFFEQLIQNRPFQEYGCSICETKSPIPFFNICYCFLRALENSTLIIDGNSSDGTQTLINTSNEILNVYIRSALYWILFHCLQYIYKNNFMYNLIQCDTQCPRDIDNSCNNILKIFKQFDFLMEKCQITINSQPWIELKKWFKAIHTEDFNKFLITFEYIFKISARMLLLLYDAQIITEQQFYAVINRHYEQFSNINTRPSLNIVQLNESFKYLIHLLEEINHATRHSKLKNDLFVMVDKLKADLFKYCLRSAESTEECNVDDIDFYVKAFRIILNDKLNFEMLNTCLHKINDNSSLAVKYFCLSLINNFVKKIDNLPEQLLKFLNNFSLPLNANKKLRGNFYQVLADTEIIYYSQYKTVSLQNESYCKRIVSFIFKSLEVGGQESILKTMELIQNVLPSIINEDSSDIKKMMTLCWNETIQLEKSSNLFWDAIQQFVQTFICKELLLHEGYCEDVIKYGYDILTQTQQIRNLAKILYDQIFALIQDEIDITALNLLIPLIVKGLLFGANFRRDERVEYDTIKLIKTLQSKYIFNNSESKLEIDSVARIRSLEAVALIKERTPILLENIFNELLSTYDSTNSDLHRIKNRFFQSMLYLHPYLNADQNKRLFNFLLKVLIEESPQKSVRYLMEWLFILIVHKEPSLITKFEEKQQEMFEKRISSLASVITVMYHLCVLNSEVFKEKAFSLIEPLTTSSDFDVRLYAQVTLNWLLENKPRKEHTTICKTSSRESFEHFKENFFLTIFNPLEHLSIETIFWDFPRLLNFTDDSLDLNYFEKSLFEHFHNTNDTLKHCEAHNRLYRNNQSAETPGVEHDEQPLDTNMYKKKLIPNKSELEIEVENEETNRLWNELTVEASSINEIPNFDKLCRRVEQLELTKQMIENIVESKWM